MAEKRKPAKMANRNVGAETIKDDGDKYVVLRDGKSIGRTTKLSFTDTKVRPGKTYRYAVRAYVAKRAGAPSL